MDASTQTRPRQGNWIQTYSGIAFWLLDPRADEIRIEAMQAEITRLRGVLRAIEAGLPAGSTLLDGRDPLWRDAYRELQRIARVGLTGEGR